MVTTGRDSLTRGSYVSVKLRRRCSSVAEQLIRNQQVVGSSPTAGSTSNRHTSATPPSPKSRFGSTFGSRFAPGVSNTSTQGQGGDFPRASSSPVGEVAPEIALITHHEMFLMTVALLLSAMSLFHNGRPSREQGPATQSSRRRALAEAGADRVVFSVGAGEINHCQRFDNQSDRSGRRRLRLL